MKPDDGSMFLWLDCDEHGEHLAISYTKPFKKDYELIESGERRCFAIKSCDKTSTIEIGEVTGEDRDCQVVKLTKLGVVTPGRLIHRCT